MVPVAAARTVAEVRVASLGPEPQSSLESAPEVARHEPVDERVAAAVDVRQQVAVDRRETERRGNEAMRNNRSSQQVKSVKLQGDSHVLLRSGPGDGQQLEAHEHVVDEVRRPADGEQDDHSDQHLHHLTRFERCTLYANELLLAGSTGAENQFPINQCVSSRYSLIYG